MIALALLALAAAAVVWGTVTNSRLTSLQDACDSAERQVAERLRHRFDLIPRLVETVRVCASREAGTLRPVIVARSAGTAALSIGDTADAVKADDSMTRGLGVALNAIAEACPGLKADEDFLSLQAELTAAESDVAFARQAFEDAITAYDRMVETFPSSAIARLLGYETRPGLMDEDDVIRSVSKVEF